MPLRAAGPSTRHIAKGECIIAVGGVGDPESAINHIIRYRVKKVGSSTTNFSFILVEGTTTIASWSENNVGESYQDGSYTLSAAEANSISNYSDLRLRISATVT